MNARTSGTKVSSMHPTSNDVTSNLSGALAVPAPEKGKTLTASELTKVRGDQPSNAAAPSHRGAMDQWLQQNATTFSPAGYRSKLQPQAKLPYAAPAPNASSKDKLQDSQPVIGLSDSSAAIDYGRSTAVNVSDTAAIRLGESTASGRVGVGGIAEGGVTDPTLTPNGYQAPPQGKHGPDISSGIKSKWLRKPKSSRSKQRMLEHAMHAASHKQQHALRLTRRVPVTAGALAGAMSPSKGLMHGVTPVGTPLGTPGVSPRHSALLSPPISPHASRGSSLARMSFGRNPRTFIPGAGFGRSGAPTPSPPLSPRANGGQSAGVSGWLGGSVTPYDACSEASGVLSGVLQSLTRDVADSVAIQSQNGDDPQAKVEVTAASLKEWLSSPAPAPYDPGLTVQTAAAHNAHLAFCEVALVHLLDHLDKQGMTYPHEFGGPEMEDPGTFADWDKEYAAKFRCMAVWIDQHMATGVCAPTTGAATTADSAALMWRTLASKSELDSFDSHLPSHPISDVHGRTAADTSATAQTDADTPDKLLELLLSMLRREAISKVAETDRVLASRSGNSTPTPSSPLGPGLLNGTEILNALTTSLYPSDRHVFANRPAFSRTPPSKSPATAPLRAPTGSPTGAGYFTGPLQGPSSPLLPSVAMGMDDLSASASPPVRNLANVVSTAGKREGSSPDAAASSAAAEAAAAAGSSPMSGGSDGLPPTGALTARDLSKSVATTSKHSRQASSSSAKPAKATKKETALAAKALAAFESTAGFPVPEGISPQSSQNTQNAGKAAPDTAEPQLPRIAAGNADSIEIEPSESLLSAQPSAADVPVHHEVFEIQPASLPSVTDKSREQETVQHTTSVNNTANNSVNSSSAQQAGKGGLQGASPAAESNGNSSKGVTPKWGHGVTYFTRPGKASNATGDAANATKKNISSSAGADVMLQDPEPTPESSMMHDIHASAVGIVRPSAPPGGSPHASLPQSPFASTPTVAQSQACAPGKAGAAAVPPQLEAGPSSFNSVSSNDFSDTVATSTLLPVSQPSGMHGGPKSEELPQGNTTQDKSMISNPSDTLETAATQPIPETSNAPEASKNQEASTEPIVMRASSRLPPRSPEDAMIAAKRSRSQNPRHRFNSKSPETSPSPGPGRRRKPHSRGASPPSTLTNSKTATKAPSPGAKHSPSRSSEDLHTGRSAGTSQSPGVTSHRIASILQMPEKALGAKSAASKSAFSATPIKVGSGEGAMHAESSGSPMHGDEALAAVVHDSPMALTADSPSPHPPQISSSPKDIPEASTGSVHAFNLPQAPTPNLANSDSYISNVSADSSTESENGSEEDYVIPPQKSVNKDTPLSRHASVAPSLDLDAHDAHAHWSPSGLQSLPEPNRATIEPASPAVLGASAHDSDDMPPGIMHDGVALSPMQPEDPASLLFSGLGISVQKPQKDGSGDAETRQGLTSDSSAQSVTVDKSAMNAGDASRSIAPVATASSSAEGSAGKAPSPRGVAPTEPRLKGIAAGAAAPVKSPGVGGAPASEAETVPVSDSVGQVSNATKVESLASTAPNATPPETDAATATGGAATTAPPVAPIASAVPAASPAADPAANPASTTPTAATPPSATAAASADSVPNPSAAAPESTYGFEGLSGLSASGSTKLPTPPPDSISVPQSPQASQSFLPTPPTVTESDFTASATKSKMHASHASKNTVAEPSPPDASSSIALEATTAQASKSASSKLTRTQKVVTQQRLWKLPLAVAADAAAAAAAALRFKSTPSSSSKSGKLAKKGSAGAASASVVDAPEPPPETPPATLATVAATDSVKEELELQLETLPTPPVAAAETLPTPPLGIAAMAASTASAAAKGKAVGGSEPPSSTAPEGPHASAPKTTPTGMKKLFIWGGAHANAKDASQQLENAENSPVNTITTPATAAASIVAIDSSKHDADIEPSMEEASNDNKNVVPSATSAEPSSLTDADTASAVSAPRVDAVATPDVESPPSGGVVNDSSSVATPPGPPAQPRPTTLREKYSINSPTKLSRDSASPTKSAERSKSPEKAVAIAPQAADFADRKVSSASVEASGVPAANREASSVGAPPATLPEASVMSLASAGGLRDSISMFSANAESSWTLSMAENTSVLSAPSEIGGLGTPYGSSQFVPGQSRDDLRASSQYDAAVSRLHSEVPIYTPLQNASSAASIPEGSGAVAAKDGSSQPGSRQSSRLSHVQKSSGLASEGAVHTAGAAVEESSIPEVKALDRASALPMHAAAAVSDTKTAATKIAEYEESHAASQATGTHPTVQAVPSSAMHGSKSPATDAADLNSNADSSSNATVYGSADATPSSPASDAFTVNEGSQRAPSRNGDVPASPAGAGASSATSGMTSPVFREPANLTWSPVRRTPASPNFESTSVSVSDARKAFEKPSELAKSAHKPKLPAVSQPVANAHASPDSDHGRVATRQDADDVSLRQSAAAIVSTSSPVSKLASSSARPAGARDSTLANVAKIPSPYVDAHNPMVQRPPEHRRTDSGKDATANILAGTAVLSPEVVSGSIRGSSKRSAKGSSSSTLTTTGGGKSSMHAADASSPEKKTPTKHAESAMPEIASGDDLGSSPGKSNSRISAGNSDSIKLRGEQYQDMHDLGTAGGSALLQKEIARRAAKKLKKKNRTVSGTGSPSADVESPASEKGSPEKAIKRERDTKGRTAPAIVHSKKNGAANNADVSDDATDTGLQHARALSSKDKASIITSSVTSSDAAGPASQQSTLPLNRATALPENATEKRPESAEDDPELKRAIALPKASQNTLRNTVAVATSAVSESDSPSKSESSGLQHATALEAVSTSGKAVATGDATVATGGKSVSTSLPQSRIPSEPESRELQRATGLEAVSTGDMLVATGDAASVSTIVKAPVSTGAATVARSGATRMGKAGSATVPSLEEPVATSASPVATGAAATAVSTGVKTSVATGGAFANSSATLPANTGSVAAQHTSSHTVDRPALETASSDLSLGQIATMHADDETRDITGELQHWPSSVSPQKFKKRTPQKESLTPSSFSLLNEGDASTSAALAQSPLSRGANPSEPPLNPGDVSPGNTSGILATGNTSGLLAAASQLAMKYAPENSHSIALSDQTTSIALSERPQNPMIHDSPQRQVSSVITGTGSLVPTNTLGHTASVATSGPVADTDDLVSEIVADRFLDGFMDDSGSFPSMHAPSGLTSRHLGDETMGIIREGSDSHFASASGHAAGMLSSGIMSTGGHESHDIADSGARVASPPPVSDSAMGGDKPQRTGETKPPTPPVETLSAAQAAMQSALQAAASATGLAPKTDSKSTRKHSSASPDGRKGPIKDEMLGTVATDDSGMSGIAPNPSPQDYAPGISKMFPPGQLPGQQWARQPTPPWQHAQHVSQQLPQHAQLGQQVPPMDAAQQAQFQYQQMQTQQLMQNMVNSMYMQQQMASIAAAAAMQQQGQMPGEQKNPDQNPNLIKFAMLRSVARQEGDNTLANVPLKQGQVVMEAVESGVPAGSMMAQSVMQNSMMQGSYASSVKSPSQMRFGSSNLGSQMSSGSSNHTGGGRGKHSIRGSSPGAASQHSAASPSRIPSRRASPSHPHRKPSPGATSSKALSASPGSHMGNSPSLMNLPPSRGGSSPGVRSMSPAVRSASPARRMLPGSGPGSASGSGMGSMIGSGMGSAGVPPPKMGKMGKSKSFMDSRRSMMAAAAAQQWPHTQHAQQMQHAGHKMPAPPPPLAGMGSSHSAMSAFSYSSRSPSSHRRPPNPAKAPSPSSSKPPSVHPQPHCTPSASPPVAAPNAPNTKSKSSSKSKYPKQKPSSMS